MKKGDIVWSIRYLFTDGIERREVQTVGTLKTAWTTKPGETDRHHGQYERIGKHVFATYREAVKAAWIARDRKMAAAERQLAKLQALKFDEQEPKP